MKYKGGTEGGQHTRRIETKDLFAEIGQQFQTFNLAVSGVWVMFEHVLYFLA